MIIFELIFKKEWIFENIENGCHQYSLSRLTGRVNCSLAKIYMLKRKERNKDNDILVAKTWENIDDYAPAIKVLPRNRNDPKAFCV